MTEKDKDMEASSLVTDQNPECRSEGSENSESDDHTPQNAIVKVRSQQEEVQITLQSLQREVEAAEAELQGFREQFPHLKTQIWSHKIRISELRGEIKKLEEQQGFLGKLERKSQTEFLPVHIDPEWHVGLVENLPVPHTKVDKATIALSVGAFVSAVVSIPLAGVSWIWLGQTLIWALIFSEFLGLAWSMLFGSHGVPVHSTYKRAMPIKVFKKYKEAKESGEFDHILVASSHDKDFTDHGSGEEGVLLGVVMKRPNLKFFRKRRGNAGSSNFRKGTAQIKDVKEAGFYEIARWGTSAESKSSI